jgi:hypothetical protein
MKDEPQEEYLERKLRALVEIVSRQHTLVIIDNVLPEHLEDLQPLLNVGWDVLLISRAPLTDGLYPFFCVEELKPNALANLFVRYAHTEIGSEEDARDFEPSLIQFYGHTLTMELLGRQIARSYLTIMRLRQWLNGQASALCRERKSITSAISRHLWHR